MKDQKLPRYLLGAFALAWPIQAAASYFSLHGQTAVYQLLMLVTMFAPFAAALLARIPLRSMGWKPAVKGKLRWVLAAWLGPAVLGALGAALYYALFPSRLDLTGAYLSAQLGEAALAQLAQAGMTLPTYLLVQVASAILLAPWLNMFAALGEEVGWRGVLYPRLKERFGVSRGRILGGLVWGVWHWPVMILAGYEYGLQYWGAPVLGLLLFCLFSTAAGTLIDLLYEKTGCIWIPSLAHGAINAFAGVPILILDPSYADRLTVGPLMSGILGGLPLLVTAAGILWLGRKRTFSHS